MNETKVCSKNLLDFTIFQYTQSLSVSLDFKEFMRISVKDFLSTKSKKKKFLTLK